MANTGYQPVVRDFPLIVAINKQRSETNELHCLIVWNLSHKHVLLAESVTGSAISSSVNDWFVEWQNSTYFWAGPLPRRRRRRPNTTNQVGCCWLYRNAGMNELNLSAHTTPRGANTTTQSASVCAERGWPRRSAIGRRQSFRDVDKQKSRFLACKQVRNLNIFYSCFLAGALEKSRASQKLRWRIRIFCSNSSVPHRSARARVIGGLNFWCRFWKVFAVGIFLRKLSSELVPPHCGSSWFAQFRIKFD